MEVFSTIRDNILAKYPAYNQGYINVSKPDGTQIVINDDSKTYAGISDSMGNYFYIYDRKQATYKPVRSNFRVQYYEKRTPCKLVSIYHNGDSENIALAMVSIITRTGCFVTKHNAEKTSVLFEETGEKKVSGKLEKISLVSIEFEVVETVSSKMCTLNLCNC